MTIKTSRQMTRTEANELTVKAVDAVVDEAIEVLAERLSAKIPGIGRLGALEILAAIGRVLEDKPPVIQFSHEYEIKR